METEMNVINAKYIRGEGQTVDEDLSKQQLMEY